MMIWIDRVKKSVVGDGGVLSHGEGAGAHAEANSAWPEHAPVAPAAVDVAVRGVVEVGRVEGAMARAAVEAPLVPNPIFRDHLLGRVYGVAASRAALAVTSFLAHLRVRVGTANIHIFYTFC